MTVKAGETVRVRISVSTQLPRTFLKKHLLDLVVKRSSGPHRWYTFGFCLYTRASTRMGELPNLAEGG